jgi:UDP-3-O-[3-hydroxymyristoyl] glucosamine N-acyltransferase
MKFTAQQIAELLDGEIEGNKEEIVNKLSKIEEGTKGSLTFLANPIYTPYIYTTHSSVVIVNKDFVPDHPVSSTLIRVENAYQAFAKLLEVYNQIKLNISGISNLAFISETASIGKNVYIGEFAYIGNNVKIGDNSKIYPSTYIGDNNSIGNNTTLYAGVKVYSDNIIGDNCNIHSGVVIGGDGFGFAPQDGSNYFKVAQTGNVIIEDDVEIGANTTIDRATLGSTILRKGVKLDNLIQIAHGVEIGENTIIIAQTGIAGSTKIGKNCVIAGQVGIVGHITIADNVKIAAQSGIGSSIKNEGTLVQGSPAFELKEYKKSYVHFKNLQKLNEKINELERKLNELTQK